MTNASDFNQTYLAPSLQWLAGVVPSVPITPEARVMLLAIAGQESNWTYRVQQNEGPFHPAHSFWQMERLGGVAGVLGDVVTRSAALALCQAAGIAADSTSVWNAFATADGDKLACGFARLLLWSDRDPLPLIPNETVAYRYYLRNWRPGAPSETRWHSVYPRSVVEIIQQEPSHE